MRLAVALLLLTTSAAWACPGSIVGTSCIVDLPFGTTSFTVPSDWDNTDNKMECWGGGAGGAGPNTFLGSIGGGTGGGYGAKNNTTQTPAVVLNVVVGGGGAGGVPVGVGGICEGDDGGNSFIYVTNPAFQIVQGGGGKASVGCSSPSGSAPSKISVGDVTFIGGAYLGGGGSGCRGAAGGGAAASHLGNGANAANCGATGGAGGVGVAEGGSGGAGGDPGVSGQPGAAIGGGGGGGGWPTGNGGAGANGLCRVTYRIAGPPTPSQPRRPFAKGWPW